MARESVSPYSYHPQAPSRLHNEALALLLRQRGSEARTVLAALASTGSLAANPSDSLAILESAGRVAAATFGRMQPGRSAMIWSPRIAFGEPAGAAGVLLKHYLTDLQTSGVRIVQALPDVAAPGDELPLLAAGFELVTDLLYLAWVASDVDQPSAADLEFVPYREALHRRLAEVVEKSYEETRDCPQLNGVREIDDVLAGYHATGEFDPALWFVIRQKDRDVGCLLLARHPPGHQWELVYVGLVPAARGSGLGRHIVRQAQWLAQRGKARQLVLAVDSANEPAIKLYASAGFSAWDRRPVYLQIFAKEKT